MIVVNNKITPLDGMIISAIKDIQSKKVVLENIAFDRVVAIEDMHGNMFAKQPELIRCKDCKYWHREIHNGIEYFNFSSCDLNHYGDGHNFYCADAERREDG